MKTPDFYSKPFFILLICLLAFTNPSLAQSIPQRISFQGKLMESDQPFTGTKDLVFSFNGTAWTETHNNVSISNGLYSVVLGESSPIPVSVFNEHSSAVLHVTVNGAALSPDITIGSTAYAFKADKADDAAKIAGITVDPTYPLGNQFLKFNGTNWAASQGDWQLDFNGNMNNTNVGNIRIGNGLNNGKLSVYGSTTAIYATGNATAAGTHGIMGSQESNIPGTAHGLYTSVNGISGYAYWGAPYHHGVAGYRYDDGNGNSSGVYGAVSISSSPSAWGSLGYQDTDIQEWGGYFHGNVFTDGQLKIAGGSPGAGKVLTSDANGLASWQAAGGGGASSQWTTTGTSIYYNTGNVGIGIAAPQGKLHVLSSDAINNSHTLEVENSTVSAAATSVTAIYGKINTSNANTAGAGVMGYSANISGGGMGVRGESAGEYGVGVYAVSTTNSNYGMALVAISNGANGYCGYFVGAKNAFTGKVGIGSVPGTGPAYMLHVAGTDDNANGHVLDAENKSVSANAGVSAIYGKINSTAVNTSGAAVHGFSASATGGGIGVKGQTAGETGRGVMGYATNGSGINYAVYGSTSSANGYASYFAGGKNYFEGKVGIGTDSPLYKLQVSGSDAAVSGRMLDVENTSTGTSANNMAIQAKINTTATVSPGSAVHGWSANGTGSGIGVTGTSEGITGKGLVGLALHNSGANYAVYGRTSSSNGFAAYFEGGKNYFEGKVGIGTNAPDDELVVGDPLYGSNTIPTISCGNAADGGAIDIVSSTVRLTMMVSKLLNTTIVSAFDADGAGNIFYNVNRIGVGYAFPTAKFHVQTGNIEKTAVFKGTLSGLDYVTLMSENTGATGTAAYFKASGTEATLALEATGTGTMLKGFGSNGGDEEINVENNGTVNIYNGNHVKTIKLDPSEFGTDDGSQITLFNNAGDAVILMDANYNGTAFGRIITSELEITGGADIAEPFDVTAISDIEPGIILSIDPEQAGKLKVSCVAYDHCVAGIVSGASNINPGLILRQSGSNADGKHLVALTGRVYCKADASVSPIKPGDLLTTSDMPGYAMKATDHTRSQGAIIGKAMTSLAEGQGLVLVLVTLQ